MKRTTPGEAVVRVLVCDDHAIVRQGIRKILEETGELAVTGEAETSSDALRLARNESFHVALVDISLPDRNGIETVRLLRKERPRMAALVLTMHTEDEFGVRAMRAGACGYLTKQSAPEQLLDAVRTVSSGRKFISTTLAEELANSLDAEAEQPPHLQLSDREYETFRLIASGHSLGEIAARLNLSPKTVSVYRARLLEKMRLRNNAQLMHYAVAHSLAD